MRRKFKFGLNLVGGSRVAILIVCTVGSLTFAQRVAHQRAIEALASTPTSPATVVLYDQYNHAGASSTLSAKFTDFSTFDSDVADDFVVPTGQTWNVQSIDADGVYFSGSGPATDWNVLFYADNAGLPGSVIYTELHQPASQSGSTFSVNLPVPAILNAGRYWVEIQANMTFGTQGEWGWTGRTVTSHNPAAWQNPGGAFGVCGHWGSKAVSCGQDPSEPDQVYRLNGTLGGSTPTPTPAPTSSPTPTPTPIPTGPPIVATNPAVNVAHFSATLNGTVNPNGLDTTVHFEYGTTTNYGSSTATQNYSGNTVQNITANLSSLRAGATYHFRIVASNTAGTVFGTDLTFTTPAARAVVADFNGDSTPDLVIQRTSTHQTAVVYLNNNVVIGAAVGPTLPAGWSLAAAADFNGDGHTDYALFNSATGQTAIVYLSGVTVISAAIGPSLSPGWELVGAADFNGDGHPDYVLYKNSTHETAIWHLNNNVFISATSGPTLPGGWNLTAVADFNGDGHPDYALFNSVSGQTVIVYLSGSTVVGAAVGPTVPGSWPLLATADFSQDGHPDYLLFNPTARQTVIGYLNNNVLINAALGPILPTGWSLVSP
jgi:hypothetical protein